MTAKLSALVPLAALLGTGCNPAAADLLEITINDGATVEVDTICADPCLGDGVTVQATFEEHIAVDFEAELQLLQYKVDYVFDSVDPAPDYYADTLAVFIGSGDSVTFDINLAAESQRVYVDDAMGDELATGTATVTFGGYDHQDALLGVTVDVPVIFGHYDSSSSDTEATQ